MALILAALAAYGVAAAALKPVEAMRSQAAEISAAGPEQRLPVPPTRDEVARLGTTLNAMLERLAEALEHERAFVADASHELRTPLAILRTELELALAEGRSPAELRAALASAAEETDRLTQLSEDLLTIAQTERGELPLRLGAVAPAEVLTGVARRFAAAPARQDARSWSRHPRRSTVEADRLRLDQAVGSMVDNALRYGAGPIELRARAGGGTVEIHVRDRGAGFPAEFLPQAFERFSRASSSQRASGSGLGLAIVRTVARAHGGEATGGEPGRGRGRRLGLAARPWHLICGLGRGPSLPPFLDPTIDRHAGGRARRHYSKVPEVTAFFWIVKALTTAMGESTSDFLVHSLVPEIAVVLGAIAFAVALYLQFSSDRYVPWRYWLAVAMVGVFGTMAADVLHVGLGVPYVVSTVFYAIVLAGVFRAWYRSEGTLSIHSITSERRELFYWAAVLATFALGTAAGDLTAVTLGLGFFASGLLFAAMIAIPAVGYFRFGMNSILAFWFAYVVDPAAGRLLRRLAGGLLRPRRPRDRHRPGQLRAGGDDRDVRRLPLLDRDRHAGRPTGRAHERPAARHRRDPAKPHDLLSADGLLRGRA